MEMDVAYGSGSLTWGYPGVKGVLPSTGGDKDHWGLVAGHEDEEHQNFFME